MTKTDDQQRLVLVTGPSGAGRVTAIRALEDIGFEAIDNLPLGMLGRLFSGPPLARPVALGLDVRNRDFSVKALMDGVEMLRGLPGIATDLLYLDCRPDVLLRRYNETRRSHPMAPDSNPADGIAAELDILAPVRRKADVLVDTSDLTPHDLRSEMERWFAPGETRRLALTVQSFSYKRGVPSGVDMVLDCRFLKNPHWQEDLRPSDGRDPAVAAYIAEDGRADSFFEKLRDMLDILLPSYVAEGRSHFSVAFGCTGGQHRSVYLAERLAEALAQAGWRVSIRHREIERRAARGRGQPKPDNGVSGA